MVNPLESSGTKITFHRMQIPVMQAFQYSSNKDEKYGQPVTLSCMPIRMSSSFPT